MTLLHARPGARSLLLPAVICLIGTGATLRACAQQQSNNLQGDGPGKEERKASWPTFMLLAGEAGKEHEVALGITAKQLTELAKKHRHNETARIKAIKHMATELGEGSAKVRAFYLSKFPVTNEQYLKYVQATGARFPFHWWKYGQPKHFKETRSVANRAYPDLKADEKKNAPLYYWEDNWQSKKLPYAIPKGQEKHPVIFVSHRDAMRFAAWAGMRLPTEVEWMLAATGGSRKQYIFGEDYNSEVAKKMNMARTRDQALKPVGALGQLAQGPFGHLDMCGGVWEWCQDMGYEPVADKKKNARELTSLQRDRKIGDRVKALDLGFNATKCIAKGGSFLSFLYNDPLQLRPSFRVGLGSEQTLESLGFRLAKSRRAAYDMSVALLRYNRPQDLPGKVKPNLQNQVGVEAYQLSADGGLIEDYNALSIVPMTYLTSNKNKSLSAMRENSRREPTPICVVISTRDLATGSLPRGQYTIYLRHPGINKDLQKALAEARKQFTKRETARKIAVKKGKEKEFKFKLKEGPWQQVIRKHGYSEAEILANTVTALSKYTYLKHGGNSIPANAKPEDKLFKVSTEKPQLLFRSLDGKWLAAVETKARIENTETYDLTPPSLTPGAKGFSFDLSFHVATTQKELSKSRGKVMRFSFPLELKQAIK